MKEAHQPKMQYDTNATWYMTRWLSYHGLYIKQKYSRSTAMSFKVEEKAVQYME
jgi:hypothetical protein